MCSTCGCGQEDVHITNGHFDEHEHHHEHNHDHHHGHEHHVHETIDLETDVLLKNNLLAERNRGYFEAKNILAFNLISSPGSGKTSLLEKILAPLVNKCPVYVIEGDQQTSLDAERIEKTGAKAVQVNTGKGCHLDADMVNKAVKKLNPDNNSLLFIENVGNLICPALFDLGESKRMVIYSVTEGDDKPLKYPHIFESSQICVLNKIDLLPYIDFDLAKATDNARKVNHHLQFYETSARTGDGIEKMVQYMEELLKDTISDSYIKHHTEGFV